MGGHTGVNTKKDRKTHTARLHPTNAHGKHERGSLLNAITHVHLPRVSAPALSHLDHPAEPFSLHSHSPLSFRPSTPRVPSPSRPCLARTSPSAPPPKARAERGTEARPAPPAAECAAAAAQGEESPTVAGRAEARRRPRRGRTPCRHLAVTLVRRPPPWGAAGVWAVAEASSRCYSMRRRRRRGAGRPPASLRIWAPRRYTASCEWRSSRR